MLNHLEDEKVCLDACCNVQAVSMLTYNILVDALCKEGKVKEAQNVVHIMNESGQYADIVIFNSFIDAYCLLGETSEEKKFLDSMLRRRVEGN
ncbi:tetratricopeptide-like helical domain-containing protein [Artemisia annua]|uniref:Tetratricopeptide-like helical domain-containing protein n=1 Tax=Artemisia annua TaxID=35608 RepID=A0A2U1NIC9_ARTAN|nr:tetratricopeptide-like helical domain-containing protein [Artemisia annua]